MGLSGMCDFWDLVTLRDLLLTMYSMFYYLAMTHEETRRFLKLLSHNFLFLEFFSVTSGYLRLPELPSVFST